MNLGPSRRRDRNPGEEVVVFERGAIAALAACLLVSAAPAAQPGKVGVGLIFVDPTGLTGKAWLSGSAALAAGIGWSAEESHYLHLHLDFLFYRLGLAAGPNLELEFYLGAGGKFIFRDSDTAWLRLPLGIDCLLRRSAFHFFFEVVPSFNFSRVKLLGAAGFRYAFRR
jgi:opacity protein-like surface antigen